MSTQSEPNTRLYGLWRQFARLAWVAAFGTTARDETDLELLNAELLRVVDETVQPEFVGLWIRGLEREAKPHE